MSETLPVTMIASLESLSRSLLEVVRGHRDAPLAELEQRVLEAVRAALPGLLQGVILSATTSLQFGKAGIKPACPECGERTGVQSWRDRTVLTVCGKVTMERPWYVCANCGRGWSPTDDSLELESRTRISPGMTEWLVHLGAGTSFAEAAGLLETLTGLTVSPETVRQRTEERGTAIEEEDQAAIDRVAKTQEAAEAVDRAPGNLVVETDGVMVRYLDGWHEVKLGLVGGYVDGRLVNPSYVAAREKAEQFGPRLLAEAARRGALEVLSWEGPLTGNGLAMLPEVAVLGDGAVWIWNLAGDHFGRRVEVIDFYHATEHLWDVAKALYGEGTSRAATWADEQIRDLYKEGAAPILRALAEAMAPDEKAAEVLQRERNFFRTNAHRMDYPAFRRQGLPIGSGAIESSAKHLVQLRLKRPGARWSDPGAQAVLAVRCRLISNRRLAA